jgi:hypothetical protein
MFAEVPPPLRLPLRAVTPASPECRVGDRGSNCAEPLSGMASNSDLPAQTRSGFRGAWDKTGTPRRPRQVGRHRRRKCRMRFVPEDHIPPRRNALDAPFGLLEPVSRLLFPSANYACCAPKETRRMTSPRPTWRGHTCLQRRDSSRRSGVPGKRIDTSVDPAGRSACATSPPQQM